MRVPYFAATGLITTALAASALAMPGDSGGGSGPNPSISAPAFDAAKTYREAQTYLQLVITVPTLPLVFAGLLGLQPKLGLMFVPFLSQHLLMTTVVRAEEIPALHVIASVGSTLVFGAILTYVAGRLYRREALLG